MNRGGKFGKKSPQDNAETKEKSNPRNPLKELNGSCSTSVEAPRGCFRFLVSNSSSKTTLPRSKTHPKTPKSAPNAKNFYLKTAASTSNPTWKLPKKNPPQSSFENLTEPRSQKPKSSNLFQWQNGRRNRDLQSKFHKQQSSVEIGTVTAPHLIEVVEDGVNSVKKLESGVCVTETQNKVLEGQSLAEPTNFSFGAVSEMNGTPSSQLPSGSCSVSAPDKAFEEHFTKPPLRASVSPTIASASVRPSELRFIPQLDIGGTPLNKFSFGSLVIAPHKPLEQHSTTPPNSSCRSALEMNTTLNKSTSGSHLVLTPETTSTPPIQASISPEITCESSLVSTPACFAAGHVVVGVSDKRKCRPRGILTVGEEVRDTDLCNSRTSLIPAPAEASMHWLSPTNNAKMGVAEGSPEFEGLVGDTTPAESVLGFSDGSTVRLSLVPSPTEASMNWLLSPCVDSEVVVVGMRSPDFGRSMGPITSVSNAATSSSPRFGNSGGSTNSPWSEILEGAATSFLSKVHIAQKKKGYRYDQLVENSPMSVDPWSSCNVTCTPVSDSTSGRRAEHPNYMNAMVGDLHTMTLSPDSLVVNCDPDDVSLVPNVDFLYPATPSNSIDATQALMLSHGQAYKREKFCGCETMSSSDLDNISQARISWREGLISRIFEMDELDCCQWLLEEEDVNYHRDDWFKSDSGLEFDQSAICSKVNVQNDMPLADGFGSPEFICDEQDEQDRGKGKRKIPSSVQTSCAESISTEGGGLAASGDSDWTVFYKNQLFKVYGIRLFGAAAADVYVLIYLAAKTKRINYRTYC